VYAVYLIYTVTLQKIYVSCLFNHLCFAFQVSPIQENLVKAGRPLYEMNQVISYRIITRSADETAFRDIVRLCNIVGVR